MKFCQIKRQNLKASKNNVNVTYTKSFIDH